MSWRTLCRGCRKGGCFRFYIYHTQPLQTRSDVVAKAAIRKHFSDLTEKEVVDVSEMPVEEGVQRQPIEVGCPICFDELGTNQSLFVFCKKASVPQGVYQNVDRIKIWNLRVQIVASPGCSSRTGVTKRQGCTGRVDEGYTNLGDLQGIFYL